MGEVFYIGAITATKISILFVLLRVFRQKGFRIAVYIVMAFCGGTCIAFIFATVFQCAPVSYSWQQLDDEKKGRCNNINLQAWTVAALSIVQDIIIIALPLKNLYELQISFEKKIMVMSMFGVGIL